MFCLRGGDTWWDHLKFLNLYAFEVHSLYNSKAIACCGWLLFDVNVKIIIVCEDWEVYSLLL